MVFLYVGGGWLFLSLCCISGIFLTVCHYLINWRRPHLRAVNDEEDILASRLYETLQAGKSLKLERAIDSALHPLCNAYGSYAEAAIKVASSGAIMGSVKIIFIGLSTAGVLAWGIQDQLTQQPQLSIGELVALFSIAGTRMGSPLFGVSG
ncbi:MAG: hypothetical protein PW845_17105 [Pseudomonas sp.]|nr:hypothetical protein [Pseudomonas sp.]